ncbi:hypothetical protein Pelo_2955 [Pelomyxa schiedti]|nr:hypothetical protein Pelo_2955 [Pelomyxa schiedti]
MGGAVACAQGTTGEKGPSTVTRFGWKAEPIREGRPQRKGAKNQQDQAGTVGQPRSGWHPPQSHGAGSSGVEIQLRPDAASRSVDTGGTPGGEGTTPGGDTEDVIVGGAMERLWTLNLKGNAEGLDTTLQTWHYITTFCTLARMATCHTHSGGMNIQFTENNQLILGSEGYVSCFACNDGQELWKTSLPNTMYWGVNIVIQSDAIYVGTYSRVFGLRLDGTIMWSADLSRMRFLAPVVLSWVKGHSSSEDLLLVGGLGFVFTLRPSTGEIIKETSLKGTGYNIMTLLLDETVTPPDSAYLCTLGHLYCCHPVTHEIKWQNELKGFGHPDGCSIGLPVQVGHNLFWLVWFGPIFGCGR